MNNPPLKLIVEAVLMSHREPLSVTQILSVFDGDAVPSEAELLETLQALTEDYQDRGVELKCLATGYCFETKPLYGPWVERIFAEKPQKYSAAFLETLAIIAYKQPVTRGEIEAIRGVQVSVSMLKSMQELQWIKTAGHRDAPGKPALYVTTKAFLDYFDLVSLSDLPPLPDLADLMSESHGT